MKERPILMTTESVKAILDGRKTMTRRVIKPQPEYDASYIGGWVIKTKKQTTSIESFNEHRYMDIGCPYGQVGDRLWVRETWAYGYTNQHPDRIIYKADNTLLPTALERGTYSASAGWGKWAPSIHMFRKDSRLTLEITGVRVERLQEITEKDAIAEGAAVKHSEDTDEAGYSFRLGFIDLWDSLNAKRGYGWDKNPWCWVIQFDNIGVRVK